MIRRAFPVRFDSIAESGRNRPLRISVETADHSEHDVFLKASARPELGVEGLANELLACCLAADLGLPVTEPFLVELDAEWIASIEDSATRQMLRESVPIAFGSKSAGAQWRIWTGTDVITEERKADALEILAFDAYIDNDDRNSRRPNCLLKGDEFRIIDHELAFKIRLKRFPVPEPWKPGYLDRLVAAGGHIFGAKLRRKVLDFEPVSQRWAHLTDERLQAYRTAVPPEWAPAHDAIEDALAHIHTIHDRLDACLAELQRVLT